MLLRRFGRTDDVIVASFLDSATDAFSAAAPEIPTSAGTVATAAFYQAVQAGETPRTAAPRGPAGPGPVRGDHVGRRALRRGGPPGRPSRPRLDHRGGVGDARALRDGRGRHHHRPPHRPGRGARRARLCMASPGVTGRQAWADPGRESRSRGAEERRARRRAEGAVGAGARRAVIPGITGGRSAPTAVRLLAVVGLLLGPELALVGSFRHSSEMLVAGRGGVPNARPGGPPLGGGDGDLAAP